MTAPLRHWVSRVLMGDRILAQASQFAKEVRAVHHALHQGLCDARRGRLRAAHPAQGAREKGALADLLEEQRMEACRIRLVSRSAASPQRKDQWLQGCLRRLSQESSGLEIAVKANTEWPREKAELGVIIALLQFVLGHAQELGRSSSI